MRCAPREVGGTNDVIVSNGVNLVDPDHNIDSYHAALDLYFLVSMIRSTKCALLSSSQFSEDFLVTTRPLLIWLSTTRFNNLCKFFCQSCIAAS